MENYRNVELLAAKIRRDVVLMIGGEGQTGHLGGSCSTAEIVAVLYGRIMRHDHKNPGWEDRDKLILSKGHAALAQYAALAEFNYFPYEEIYNVKEIGSNLQGHPDRLRTKGIEAGTGSLGQGLSVALGMALAMKLDKKDNTVFCIIGDGEIAEGQIWEAAMAAVNFEADNLVAVVDMNRLQATGAIRDRFDTTPLFDKWTGFGWNVMEVDGHSVSRLIWAFEEAARIKSKPTVIIAETVKGKGISFAEDDVAFHNGSMTEEQYRLALNELDMCINELKGGAADEHA